MKWFIKGLWLLFAIFLVLVLAPVTRAHQYGIVLASLENTLESHPRTSEDDCLVLGQKIGLELAKERYHNRGYTDLDLQMLANTVWYEAPYCKDRHQRLVAQVVLNRTKDPRFPDTIEEVIIQPGQYGVGYNKNLPNLHTKDPEMRRCIEAARDALDGEVDCPADVVFQAQFIQGKEIYEIWVVDTEWYTSTTYFCKG